MQEKLFWLEVVWLVLELCVIMGLDFQMSLVQLIKQGTNMEHFYVKRVLSEEFLEC